MTIDGLLLIKGCLGCLGRLLCLTVKVGLDLSLGLLAQDTGANRGSGIAKRVSSAEPCLNRGIGLGLLAGFVGVSDSERRGHARTEKATGNRRFHGVRYNFRDWLARVDRDLVNDATGELVETLF